MHAHRADAMQTETHADQPSVQPSKIRTDIRLGNFPPEGYSVEASYLHETLQ
jgi:hypothetical protein